MASQVPTGYNPEASLLQGGTAPILPVQGGGSMEAGASLPPGYNPNESLLNTGQNAPIVPIKGGANGNTASLPSYDGYVMEYYIPPVSSAPIPPPPERASKQRVMTEYESATLPKLKKLDDYGIDPVTYISENDDNPTYRRICPTPAPGEKQKRRLPTNFFKKIRRRIITIENDSPTIWLIHNLNGERGRYMQFMNLVPKTKEGLIDPNHFVVFTGNFLSPVLGFENNPHLYYMFLEDKIKNLSNLFYLTSLTEDFVLTSCNLLNDAYSTKTLASESKERIVYPFLEPDVLVFKKQQIVLANGPLPVKKPAIPDPSKQDICLSILLGKKDPRNLYKDIVIVPTPGVEEDKLPTKPIDKKYFIVDQSERQKIEFPDDKNVVKCPKDEASQGFQGGYKLVDLNDDKTLPTSGVYILRKNPDMNCFFAPKSAEGAPKKPEEAPKKPEEAPKKPEEAPKKPEEAPKKPEGLTEEEEIDLDDLIPKEPPVKIVKPEQDEPFESASSAKEADETTIELNTKEYRLRNSSDKEVRENWTNGVFTDNEVEFLQALQLTPKLLELAFGKSQWKLRLADFLQSIVLSNCYVDTTLLTKIECSNAQEFIKQVYMQMFHRSLEQMYNEMGIPKPKMLSELIDEVKRLKQLGPTGGLLSISKFDFTGDLLERFHKIYYDAQKGEYYYDFAELTDATREFLQKLKFSRVQDVNPEEITKKILERMNIPLPKGGPPAASGPPKGGPPAASGPPKGGPSEPPAPTNTYTLEQITNYSPIPLTFFTNYFVLDDGLCFPRAVLKALQPNPVSDSKKKADIPYIYNPDEPTSIAFLKEITQYIRAHKPDIKIKNVNSTGIVEIPVQEYFERKYKPKASEPVEVSVKTADRIRVGTVYKKLTLEEYLTLLDTETNPLIRPFAEVNDAGIGIAAAKLKDIVIIIYNQGPGGYRVSSIINEEAASTPQPLSKFIFLEWEGGNHYNTLHIAPGQTWPKPTAGGQIEEVLEAADVLDMGELVEDILPRKSYSKKTRKANKNYSPKTRKQSRRHR